MTHAQFSSKGGKARKKALSPGRRKEIASKAARASWRSPKRKSRKPSPKASAPTGRQASARNRFMKAQSIKELGRHVRILQKNYDDNGTDVAMRNLENAQRRLWNAQNALKPATRARKTR